MRVEYETCHNLAQEVDVDCVQFFDVDATDTGRMRAKVLEQVVVRPSPSKT